LGTPAAGRANRQGRIAASNALGIPLKYSGALGSSVVKVFDATAASTGLTESAARESGFEVGAAIVVHCKSGFRSHLALRILKENGWTDLRNLTGGYVIVMALGGFDTEEA
jgi:NADPH-dependent 2,4-dienoyl-CoA reductase/sulfur reductase-like enzyme